ncbi:hypothetical protein DFS33DRAFT_1453698, partial [Desarmillaria ectypa]
MASTRSTPFSIDEFASLVENALDLDHEPDVSIRVPTTAWFDSPSPRRPTSTTTVLSKFKQLVSPPRQRLFPPELPQPPVVPIPIVSLVASKSSEFIPYLPIPSRRELEARQACKERPLSSPPSSPSSSSTRTDTESVWTDSEPRSIRSEPSSTSTGDIDDPFAKGTVQILHVPAYPGYHTPKKKRSRPAPLSLTPPRYAPPSCPLPSPPATPSPRKRHPYASDWTLDLPTTRRSKVPSHNPLNPLSPRRGLHRRTGSPFPLTLTIHDTRPVKTKTHLTLDHNPCRLVLGENGLPVSPPGTPEHSSVEFEARKADWVDMTDSDSESSREEGVETPVQPSFPSWSRDDDTESVTSAYYTARLFSVSAFSVSLYRTYGLTQLSCHSLIFSVYLKFDPHDGATVGSVRIGRVSGSLQLPGYLLFHYTTWSRFQIQVFKRPRNTSDIPEVADRYPDFPSNSQPGARQEDSYTRCDSKLHYHFLCGGRTPPKIDLIAASSEQPFMPLRLALIMSYIQHGDGPSEARHPSGSLQSSGNIRSYKGAGSDFPHNYGFPIGELGPRDHYA